MQNSVNKKVIMVIASIQRADQMLGFFYQELKKKGAEVTIFCDDLVYNYLQPFIENERITRKKLISYPVKCLAMMIHHLRVYTLINPRATIAIIESLARDIKESKFFISCIAWPLSKILRRIKCFNRSKFWDKLESLLIRNGEYSAFFKNNQYDAIIFPTPLLRLNELVAYIEARRAGVKTYAIDESFGEFVCHIDTVRTFNKIFVWNKYTIEQGVKFFNLNPQQFKIVGPYRFDPYFKNDIIPSREQFFKVNNLDVNKKLITFAAMGLDIEDRIISELVKKIKLDGFYQPAQLLFRINPFIKTSTNYREFYQTEKSIKIDNPNETVVYPVGNFLQRRYIHLAATLKYSDALICMGSTLAIEASIFNTPTIYYLFGSERYKNYDKFEFLQEVINTGAVPLARSIENLFELINEVLKYPQLLTEERRNLSQKLCTYLDGQSSKRIVDYMFTKL